MLQQFKRNKERWQKYLGYFLVGVGVVVVYFTLRNIHLIMGSLKNFILLIRPIIIAFAIAYILNRPMQWIEQALSRLTKRMVKRDLSSGSRRVISILILFLLVVGAIYFLFNSIIPPIFTNLRLLLESLPALQSSINRYMNEFGPYVQTVITEQQIDQISHLVTNILSSLGTHALQVGTGVITNVTGFAISTLTTIILSVYFLKDKEVLIDSLHKGAQALLSTRTLRRCKQLLVDLDTVFGGFLIAQLIAALLAGVCSTIILLIINHPFAILVGLVAGIANVIPYIGPILGAVLGFVLALFSSWQLAVLTLILLTIYQQLDANVIQPKLLSNSVGLNPVWVLIAILIGGHYLGMLGMIVSIPSAALAQIYLSRRYHRLKQSGMLTEKGFASDETN